MYRLISLLSGCTLKAAFVSEGYFHEDVQHPSPCPLLLSLILCLVVLSRRLLAHPSSLKAPEVLFQKSDLAMIVSPPRALRETERTCACVRTSVRENTDGLSCLREEGKGAKKKEKKRRRGP